MDELPRILATAAIAPQLWWLIVVWVVVLGGSMGSFLNVVVYRMPRGMSLSRPASRCPACRHPIRWYHNLPVLGWFILRGRCRDCGARISPRYPAVEAVTACSFAALAVAGPLTGGANLPITDTLQSPNQLSSAMLWGVYAYHLLLVCVLLVAGLMELDGHCLAFRPLAVVILIGLVAPIVWPSLHPVPFIRVLDHFLWSDLMPVARLAAGFGNLAAGAVLGGLIWPATGLGLAGNRSHRTAVCLSVLVCVYLGWQAALAIMAIVTISHLFVTLCSACSGGKKFLVWSLLVPLITTPWLLCWSAIVRRAEMFADQAGLASTAILATVVATCSVMAWAIARRWVH